MKSITEEMMLHEEWHKEARRTKTMDDLTNFINDKLSNYTHDYGTICHAMVTSMIATMSAMNNSMQGGITGFQANCIANEVFMRLNFSDNKTGIRVLNMDHLLYPQYEDNFKKTISKTTWEALKKEAKLKLESRFAHEDVLKHWQSIVDGKIPFGFVVKEEGSAYDPDKKN